MIKEKGDNNERRACTLDTQKLLQNASAGLDSDLRCVARGREQREWRKSKRLVEAHAMVLSLPGLLETKQLHTSARGEKKSQSKVTRGWTRVKVTKGDVCRVWVRDVLGTASSGCLEIAVENGSLGLSSSGSTGSFLRAFRGPCSRQFNVVPFTVNKCHLWGAGPSPRLVLTLGCFFQHARHPE